MSDTNINDATSALRVYEAHMEAAVMSQLTRIQTLQVITEQQSAQGDKISAKALQAIREKKAAEEASSLRNPASLMILSGAAVFSLGAGVTSIPNVNKNTYIASAFKVNVNSPTQLVKDTERVSRSINQISQFAQTSEKIVSTRTEATRTELRSEQQIAQGEEQNKQSERQRKLQREDQVNNQISSQQQQEFATKKAIVTGS